MNAATPVRRALDAFRRNFGVDPVRILFAPGRVNLIGEHTDYNDGFVLPCAIDRGTAVAIGPANDASIDAISVDFDARDRFDPGLPFSAPDPGWRAHVRGVVAAMRDRGIAVGGAKIAIAGDVPLGAGLSSSASLGVALAAALAGDQEFDPTELARIAQAAENDYVGCACGIMDQLAAARGQAGAALMIDCRSLDIRAVPLPDEMAILIVHSGIARGLVDSAYNERRRSCEAVASHFGLPALRDLALERLDDEAARIDPIAYCRARHVVTEHARVLAMIAAIERSDWTAIGELMARSHQSMRDDFEITVPPIDRLVARLAAEIIGQGGARMTGGGFGGCVVALAPQRAMASLKQAALDHFVAEGQPLALIHVCRPSGGLCEVERGHWEG